MTPVKTQPAGRRSAASPLRRASSLVLIAGAVLAILAAFGPIWVVRAGIAIALIAGFIAIRYAWRELKQAHEEAGQKSLEQLRSHNTLLSAERQRTNEVISTLREHNEADAERLVDLQVTVGRLRTQISTLRGDHAALQNDLAQRDQRISQLQATLAERVAELQEFRNESEDAEILAIPRYAAVADWDALPSAEDLWSDGNHPTVVDLQKLAYPSVTEQKHLRQA